MSASLRGKNSTVQHEKTATALSVTASRFNPKPLETSSRKKRGTLHYCGKSAVDDAIENTPCGADQSEPCEACGGTGWLFCLAEGDHPPREEIQCCDACQRFEDDLAALKAVVKAAQSQPALLAYVEKIAGLKHENEPDDNGPFERTSEDSIATLNQLILEARTLKGET
jgi:hypothetical protein